MDLIGIDATTAALLKAQPVLAAETLPVLRELAQDVKTRATSAVDRHPSGLWRGAPGASYRVRKKGYFWYQVLSPSNAAGRAEAMSEFAKRGWTPQGAALVRGLDSVYGARHGGRILWKTYDDMQAELVARFEQAVNEAAAKIEKEASTVG